MEVPVSSLQGKNEEMKVSAKGGSFKPVPQGLHLGICTEVVDLGTQTGEYRKGNVVSVKHQRKVAIRWTLPTVLYEEGDKAGQPMGIGKTYTASLDEKSNLRKDAESWRGQAFTAKELDGFNLSALLGKPCQLQVIHETKGDKTYANIKSIVGVMKGTPIPAVDTELRMFDLDDFDQETFDALPDWQKEKIVASPEYIDVMGARADTVAANGGANGKSSAAGTDDDDIPF
jgi:hypothetical protein